MSLRRKAEEGAHAGARKASTIDRVRKRRCACVATCRVEAASRIPDPIDPTDPSPRSRPRPSRGCRCPVPLPRLGRGRGRSLRALSTRCATPAAPGRARSIPAKAHASPRRPPALSAEQSEFGWPLGTKAPWSCSCGRDRSSASGRNGPRHRVGQEWASPKSVGAKKPSLRREIGSGSEESRRSRRRCPKPATPGKSHGTRHSGARPPTWAISCSEGGACEAAAATAARSSPGCSDSRWTERQQSRSGRSLPHPRWRTVPPWSCASDSGLTAPPRLR